MPLVGVELCITPLAFIDLNIVNGSYTQIHAPLPKELRQIKGRWKYEQSGVWACRWGYHVPDIPNLHVNRNFVQPLEGEKRLMNVSGNEIPYNVDTQGIESLLQSIDEKLGLTNETLSALAEPDEPEEQEEIETVSDNSIAIYESLQRLEQRQDINIKLFVAIGGLLLIAVGILIGLSVMKWLPKR